MLCVDYNKKDLFVAKCEKYFYGSNCTARLIGHVLNTSTFCPLILCFGCINNNFYLMQYNTLLQLQSCVADQWELSLLICQFYLFFLCLCNSSILMPCFDKKHYKSGLICVVICFYFMMMCLDDIKEEDFINFMQSHDKSC